MVARPTRYFTRTTIRQITKENKMKINTKTIGKITGKVFAGTKALPSKTASTSKSIKDEFLAGFSETSGSSKGVGSQSLAQNTDNTQQ